MFTLESISPDARMTGILEKDIKIANAQMCRMAACLQTELQLTKTLRQATTWSHYCTLNEDGEVVDRGRFRTTLSGVEKWFTDVPRARVAMETGTHSIWVSEQPPGAGSRGDSG